MFNIRILSIVAFVIGFALMPSQSLAAFDCGDTVTTACSSGVVSAAQYASNQCGQCGTNSYSVGGGCYRFECGAGSQSTPTPTPAPTPTRVAYSCGSGVVSAAQTAAQICGTSGYYTTTTNNYCYSFYCN
ncbi:hypothetical protein [Teredinibacter purpureus]|uniref:hypothetical protein n=1 Tax=Teredinibacter purpureus TaxID=2731756 RepID=UPI0005F80DA1|nr:hypothetical protein [Teredinibacter purpureus]